MCPSKENRRAVGWVPHVLAHRARKGGRVVARPPHVLARRAHRIDRSGQGWIVCSPDARSLRRPGHLPDELWIDQMVLGARTQLGSSQPPRKWIDLRPPFGKGCVLARLGWVGVRGAFLSILTESGRL